jgi:hypothetical protein
MPNKDNWVKMPFSVNQALDQLESHTGTDIVVFGEFAFEFEHVALYHIPTCERRDGDASSLWLSIGTECLGFDREVCQKWHGKVVLVKGKLLKPDPYFGGCGHMSLWSAEILVETMERYKHRNDE